MVSSVFLVPLPVAAPRKSFATRGKRPAVGGRRAAGNVSRRAPSNDGGSALLLTDFVGDQENQLVRLVVDSFLAPPRYNPLVIAGPAEVGKSALTSGLGRRWNDHYPEAPALLMTGEEFARGYADALETDSLDAFRRKFTQAGAVLIDGLESLVEKLPAQWELARRLDDLCDANVPVLVSCRREPELPRFHPALASRLLGGLVAPLVPPGDAARRKILADLLAQRRLRLQPAAFESLADSVAADRSTRPTVPQLASLVERLAAQASEEPQPWSADVIERHLANRAPTCDVTVAQIVKVVAEYFGLRVSDVKGASRRRQVVHARGIATYLARQFTGQSLESLGQFFGGRDHTTTLHACRTIEERLQSDPLVQQAVAAITQRVQATCSPKS